jgi:predicted transposase YbfD/YdcC
VDNTERKISYYSSMKKNIGDYFSNIPDPRVDRCKAHLLEDVVLLAIIAAICGCESWETIEEFGKSKKEFLKNYLKIPNGIPSHDTIERLFKRIDSKAFAKSFMDWTDAMRTKWEGDLLNIDGKTIRGSKDEGNGKYAIHLVSAWSHRNRLVLGQVKTSGKSNEIAAVKELLTLLDIKGAVITADAMSCQKEIVQQICTKEADYIIAIKDNQKNLKAAIAFEFKTQSKIIHHETLEKNHGRIETRICEVISNLTEIENKELWTNLKSVIKITSIREMNAVVTKEERFYISSLNQTADYFNTAIRNHWAVENNLHWVLDVQFNEDKSRKRKDNAAENFAIVRRFALTKITQAPLKRYGVNNRRLIAALNEEYLIKVLGNL